MKAQVEPSHYNFLRYVSKERFTNYWYQLQAVFSCRPTSVLEIGPGDQIVTSIMKKNGIEVTTVDIDERLRPDVLASVDSLPFPESAFDLVLCSEVLEHLPYEIFSKAIAELRRVSKKHVVIGLPHAGGVFYFSFKIPLLPRATVFFKVPFFWKTHQFNGEHYWELGKKGSSSSRVLRDIQKVGFHIVQSEIHGDDMAHRLFLLEKI